MHAVRDRTSPACIRTLIVLNKGYSIGWPVTVTAIPVKSPEAKSIILKYFIIDLWLVLKKNVEL